MPATIITSDCLGEPLGAAPNLSRSYLGMDVCIISTAQQARPKVIQCNEPALAQLTKFSNEVVIKPLSVKSFANFLNSSGILFSPKNPDPEKLSAYECGFEPFNDSRMEFDVRFYLVAILFIIFDLEIAFLFPWAISLGNIGLLGFISMMIFLFILTVGFIYEWKKGALDWE